MFYILLQEFIGDLKAQRTRAFLTFFAVTWGTLAVVLLLAFGEGLKRTVRDGLLGAGERIFMIYGGETSKSFAGLGQGRQIRLVEEDLDLLERAIPDIDRGSISYGRWGTAFQVGKTRTNAFLEGVGPDHEAMRHMEPAQGGRFINPTDERALGMWDFIESEKETLAVGLGIQVFMGLVGAFTLLIAGVGVANIMYVVVKERTQEIGVKLALGARRRHIMAQFLFEAMAIAVSGGLVGLVTAELIVTGVDAIPTEGNPAMQYILNPKLSWPIALICVGILISVGLLAGVLPARRAAAVDPVESLRYE